MEKKDVEKSAKEKIFEVGAENSCEAMDVTMRSETDDTASLSEESDSIESDLESRKIEYSPD